MTRRRTPSAQTLAVLEALLEAGDGWSYGYELCRALGLKAGTIYPILMRLADRGQLETSWEHDTPPGRPPRHLYRLSPAGIELVEEVRARRSPALRPLGPALRRPGPGTVGA